MKMMNKDKIDAMKEQEHMRAKMQAAYKVWQTCVGSRSTREHILTSVLFVMFQAGDMETVKKIEYQLLPDEEKEKLKRNMV